MNRTSALLGIVLLLAPAQRGGAQPNAPSLTQSLTSLGRQLTRVPNASLSMNFAEWRARVAVSNLENLARNWPAESPADYRANLARHVTLLEDALVGGDAARLTALLEALADDLEVKLEHCKQSGGKLGGSVTVQVRTVHEGQEIRNWQVFYLPKMLDAMGGTADRFPQLSSPTSETLVPGRYVMWVRDSASSKTGDKVVVKVGEGKQALILDLPVPAGASR
jgi:hypothetical protein